MKMDIDSKKHQLLEMIRPSTYYVGDVFSSYDVYDRTQIHLFQMGDFSEERDTFGICKKSNSDCQKLFEKLKENNFCIASLDAWYPQKLSETSKDWGAIWALPVEMGNIQIKLCW
jgi:hypothetical protein